ncbi:MAG: bifunctional 5,10-methylenetetrahydrofolate dehydrogenase/5,10-methenyltetrahydrofolate cyclohydrolase [Patescibacteria group bacterium]|nr:bifunctional 5,10-methylenetetrahydrofolate dehydrogenase/5,10-methenyltetrahydrofolate cyclohydrolase [Patescibacteria group bacterium]
MAAKILDGRRIKKKIVKKLREKVAKLKKKPGLAIILIGNDPASKIYVKQKINACLEAGFYCKKVVFPEDVSQKKVLDCLEGLNSDSKIHGIVLQLPIGKNLSTAEREILERIDPKKDIDCLHPLNLGRLFISKNNIEPIFFPATARGIIKLLKEYEIDLGGKKITLVGRSQLVGKPLTLMLTNEQATVTLTHSKTPNLKDETNAADIVIVAVGKKHYFKKEFFKNKAIVVDVGVTREGKQVFGDVDFRDVFDKIAAITPVPGGVGPMTVASLLENLFFAYQNQEK